MKTLKFIPDWYVPTGAFLCDLMKEFDISKEYLSHSLGEDNNDYVEHLLAGEATVGKQTASTLSTVFGGSPEFWLRLDEHYQAELLRIDGVRLEQKK